MLINADLPGVTLSKDAPTRPMRCVLVVGCVVCLGGGGFSTWALVLGVWDVTLPEGVPTTAHEVGASCFGEGAGGRVGRCRRPCSFNVDMLSVALRTREVRHTWEGSNVMSCPPHMMPHHVSLT
jgi:hypothetical protein